MKKTIVIFILFSLTILTFKGLSQTFYQQDEWHSLGVMRQSGIEFIFSESSPFDILTLANRPIARLVGVMLLGGFPFNIAPYVFFSLALHSINAFLVYLLIKNLNLSKTSALVGSIFFLFNASGKQAILWISAGIATLPSTTAILIALLFYLFYLKTDKHRFLIWSILSVVFSLTFKENGLFILLLIPLLEFFHNLTRQKKFMISKSSIILLLFSALIFVFKFFSVFFVTSSTSRYVNISSEGGAWRLIWNSITFPIESISQIFIPDLAIFPFARKVTENIFPYFESTGYAGVVSEKIIVELLSLLAAFFILPIVIFLFQRKDKFPVILALLFYIFSFIPYIVLIKSNGYLESRYYYLSVASAAIFLSLFVSDAINFLKNKISRKGLRLIFYIVLLILFLKYCSLQITYIQKQIDFQIQKAVVQKPLLERMFKLRPKFSEKQVIFIDSDHEFITPGNPLPFQAGVGYVLLTYYAYKTDDAGLTSFLQDDYFWQLGNQGYREYGSRGFGFYANEEILKKETAMYKIDPENVTSFRYDSVKNKIYDITIEIQKALE